MTTTTSAKPCHRTKAVQKLRLLAIVILLAIAAIWMLSGCEGIRVELRQPTDFGTAIVRTQDGKTDVQFELPRK